MLMPTATTSAVGAGQRSTDRGPSDDGNYIRLSVNQPYAGRFEAAETNTAKEFELKLNPPIWYSDEFSTDLPLALTGFRRMAGFNGSEANARMLFAFHHRRTG
jgi:hypothetical protein